MTPGLFLVLEGGDGAGKTTQVGLLSAWLDERGVDHVTTREPGGTPVGEAIRSVVLGREDLEMPSETELLLILAARAAFVQEVVEPELTVGRHVVADRFSLSTLAYQGYGRGLPLDQVRQGIRIATRGREPDLTLVLDVPVERAVERQEAGADVPDRIEKAGSDFRRRVRAGYLALAAERADVELVDGSGTVEEVHDLVTSVIMRRFAERFPALGDEVGSRGSEGEGE